MANDSEYISSEDERCKFYLIDKQYRINFIIINKYFSRDYETNDKTEEEKLQTKV